MQRNLIKKEKQASVSTKSYGDLTADDFGMKQVEHLTKRLEEEPFPDRVLVASLSGECDRDG